jgi:hypothetical protein
MRLGWVAGALVCIAAHAALADDGFGYPDWIRMKDSVSIRCRILSERDNEVEAVMSGGEGEEKITIDRTQIEWMQRNSIPDKKRDKGWKPAASGARP